MSFPYNSEKKILPNFAFSLPKGKLHESKDFCLFLFNAVFPST